MFSFGANTTSPADGELAAVFAATRSSSAPVVPRRPAPPTKPLLPPPAPSLQSPLLASTKTPVAAAAGAAPRAAASEPPKARLPKAKKTRWQDRSPAAPATISANDPTDTAATAASTPPAAPFSTGIVSPGEAPTQSNPVGAVAPSHRRNRDDPERVVFLGNVTTRVSERSVLRELKKLLSKYGKVESIRFRSIAFNHVKNRKAAFLSKDFHEGRDTLNAYVVFKEKDAATSALELNGTVFEGKHLRADRSVPSQRTHDPKRSVFLGNLPFDVAEEDVWNAFEDCGEIVYVRIIRDSATNLGKGFGYVQFSDPLAADLALQRGPVDVSGREIRVTRCARRGAASSSEGVRSAPLARPALRAKGRRTGVQGASGATRPAAQKRGGKPPRKSK